MHGRHLRLRVRAHGLSQRRAIQIRYESHLSAKEFEDWKVANFNRLFASLNVDSGVRINNLAKKIKSDSENDYIQLISVLGNDYQLNWLYTNKFHYI